MARMQTPITLQLRLTAVYGGLFVAMGTVLLAITYGLLARQLPVRGRASALLLPNGPPGAAGSRPENADAMRQHLEAALAQQRADTLGELLTQSALALAIASVIAVALGWVVARRVLRPLRDITATARRLSTHNLDERINLRGPRDELTELADTFDAMLSRLAAAFDAQRRFVANASHELKTPLAVQNAAIDVALAAPHPTIESMRTMAQRVRRATQRHEHLINSLLALARSERGIENYDDVDLAQTLKAALATARPHIEAGHLRVTRSLRSVPVRGDRVLLEQLAGNLVDNAVRHNTSGGWIDVHTAADGATATVRIANAGPVIPPELIEALFEPFRRHAPDRATEGNGLGLSIVAAIVAAHHGTRDARPPARRRSRHHHHTAPSARPAVGAVGFRR